MESSNNEGDKALPTKSLSTESSRLMNWLHLIVLLAKRPMKTPKQLKLLPMSLFAPQKLMVRPYW